MHLQFERLILLAIGLIPFAAHGATANNWLGSGTVPYTWNSGSNWTSGAPLELVSYPGVQHGFNLEGLSRNDAAAKDAWQRTVGWLARYLGG